MAEILQPLRWPCPGAGADGEWALVSGDGAGETCPAPPLPAGGRGNCAARVLIVPPLFDEMNRARAMLVATIRHLNAARVVAVLPDLPGCGESVQNFAAQSLDAWRAAMTAAARHFAASHVLAVRGGALVAPATLPGWALAPLSGDAVLRPLLRAAALAARAKGQDANAATLLEQGRTQGLVLGGYPCGAALIAGLHGAQGQGEGHQTLAVADLDATGPAPWLRQEPAPAPALAAALAARLAQDLRA